MLFLRVELSACAATSTMLSSSASAFTENSVGDEDGVTISTLRVNTLTYDGKDTRLSAQKTRLML